MAKKVKRLGSGSLLNKPTHHSTAAISYSITECYRKGKYDSHPQLCISDCSEVVNLDFRYETKRDYKNSKFKIKAIRKVLDKLERDLEHARRHNIQVEEEENA